jgi:quercetin dioxygenase-like cupin family protein
MAEDAETGDGVEEHEAYGDVEPDPDAPYFVEVWNDYDPSQRFASIFPVGEKEGARASSVAYYIIEPGRHTGLHNDNVEEIAFIAEGEGEVFVVGETRQLDAGTFTVFPAGIDHDIYARGSEALRLLSFFPAPEIVSTFQQAIYPMGGNILSSKPPSAEPVVTELDPNNLPENFPFDLSELGMAPEEGAAPRELTPTEIALGITEPGGRIPDDIEIKVITPGEEPAEDSGPEAKPEG